jgi:hypothetical protein
MSHMPNAHMNCSHQERLPFSLGLLVFFTLLAAPTALVWLRSFPDSPADLVFFIMLPMLFVGVAYDTTELVLSLALQPRPLPQARLTSFPPVAVLMTVCDDVCREALKGLGSQSYPNYSVFILDDSLDEEERMLVDRAGHAVLRRARRQGHKAGNLNFWLDTYGTSYKYFVILDSDSIISEDFVERMVEYAEHPLNAGVAVFQSKVVPWNTRELFPRLLGAVAPLRMYILELVANRTGTMLSLGHNNLMRTTSAQQVGGFHEYLTAEDTVLTLMLSAIGQETKLVDVTSYEAEPRDVLRFARRTIRWAKQTVELFRLPWQRASFRLKAILCYHLYSYSVPAISLCLLLVAVFGSLQESGEPRSPPMPTSLGIQIGSIHSCLTTVAVAMYFWAIPMTLRFVLAIKTHVPIRYVLAHCLLCMSLGFCLAVHIAAGMLRTALGCKVSFAPTNGLSAKRANQQTLQAFIGCMLPAFAYCMLILLGIIRHHSPTIMSLISIALGLFSTVLVILFWFYRDTRSAENIQ